LEKAKKLNLFKDFNWDDLIEFNITPPYIPKTPLLKEFKDYTIQYLLYVKKELEEKIKNDDSLLSSYYDDDKNIDYDSNWADNF
jgi:hypothetical protein